MLSIFIILYKKLDTSIEMCYIMVYCYFALTVSYLLEVWKLAVSANSTNLNKGSMTSQLFLFSKILYITRQSYLLKVGLRTDYRGFYALWFVLTDFFLFSANSYVKFFLFSTNSYVKYF